MRWLPLLVLLLPACRCNEAKAEYHGWGMLDGGLTAGLGNAGQAGGGGAPELPTANLVFDFDSRSGVYTTSACSTAVTASNADQTFGCWEDQVSSYQAIQATAADQPTYLPNALNGSVPGIYCNSQAGLIATSVTAIADSSEAYSILIVHESMFYETSTDSSVIFDYHDATFTDRITLLQTGDHTRALANHDGSNVDINSGSNIRGSNVHITHLSFDVNASPEVVKSQDNSTTATSASAATSVGDGITTLSICGNADSSSAQGVVYRVLGYSAVLSGTPLANAIANLDSVYGLSY